MKKDAWVCNNCFEENTGERILCKSLGCEVTYEKNREIDLEGRKIQVVEYGGKLPEFKYTDTGDQWRARGREER